jgi:glucosamine 6-phosphate synthetase-like amidotransferase/phosphosugar isomerase protein
MCGLAGILLFPARRSATEWLAIRQCFTQTLIFNEERGREAAGMALIRRDGSYRLLKEPVPASDLVAGEAYRDLLAQVDAETTCLLGHTRAPTKGSRWNNANNHPLVAGQVVGIHNGHIDNDDELFAQLDLPRQGQVDSEIIFRLFDTISLHSRNGTYLQAVRRRTNMLRGRFATLSVDLWQPGRLLAVKKDMPLCVHYHAPWQALCFSSRYLFLRKAFGRSVITEALDSRQIYLFDAERLPEQGKEPAGSLVLSQGQE